MRLVQTGPRQATDLIRPGPRMRWTLCPSKDLVIFSIFHRTFSYLLPTRSNTRLPSNVTSSARMTRIWAQSIASLLFSAELKDCIPTFFLSNTSRSTKWSLLCLTFKDPLEIERTVIYSVSFNRKPPPYYSLSSVWYNISICLYSNSAEYRKLIFKFVMLFYQFIRQSVDTQ